MQNVLKRKNVFLMKKFAKCINHLCLFYVLEYSGSFYMHIEKLYKKISFLSKVRKKREGLRTLRAGPYVTIVTVLYYIIQPLS